MLCRSMAGPTPATRSWACTRGSTGSAIRLMGAVGLTFPVAKGRSRMAAQNSSDVARKTADQCGTNWRSIVIRPASVAIAAQIRPLCFDPAYPSSATLALIHLNQTVTPGAQEFLQSAHTGDFVLTAEEVNPVVRALRSNGIEVTALHNHMLNDEPRLFFNAFLG